MPPTESLRLRDKSVVWQMIEGEVIALDVRRSVYLQINRSGSVLWPALASGATRSELVDLLRRSFDVDASTAAADLDEFLDHLRDHDLVEVAERPSPP